MAEVNLPEGYSFDDHPILEKKVGKEKSNVEYTILRKDGEIVLALPTEHCTPQRIEEVIRQTRKGDFLDKSTIII